MATLMPPSPFVAAISIDDLQATANHEANEEQRGRAPFPAALAQAELAHVRAWRRRRGCDEEQAGRDTLVGLALSGGGIRSATFALGAMQALASRGLLERVDYLSTVSGGGYIGGALTWLTSARAETDQAAAAQQSAQPPLPPFGLGAKNFPFGTDDPRPDGPREAPDAQRRMLMYLREHGYYLTPGAGISALSLFGIVLRGTFLNLVVWMPVLVLVFLVGFWIFQAHNPGVGGLVLLSLLMDVEGRAELYGFELLLRIGLGLLALTLIGTLGYALLTRVRREQTSDAIAHAWYRSRRFAERFSALLIAAIVLLLVMGSLPAISYHLRDTLGGLGPAAMLTGIAGAMRSFLTGSPSRRSTKPDLIANLASGLFLFGALLVGFDLAARLAHGALGVPAALGLVAAALTFGWFVNINYTSIHRYYRDRLMETFMPDIARAQRCETGAAVGADTARLTALREARGPYHIINTNVVLADSDLRLYRHRGGDSFILSPWYCGSNATGWCPTEVFCEGQMTLATAVAISGAAVNPNTGVGGVGLTRARLVSFVMALLSLRLGYWAGHPDPAKAPRHPPNHFRPGAYAFANLLDIDRFGFNEHRGFLQLSDGGHFENTGVYELVRRRARLILVCDGGADAAFSFSDFQTTVRRVEQDFGVRIKALDDASPDFVVPAPPPETRFPLERRFSPQGHLVAWIEYADGTRGWLIYLKATLTEAMSFKVKGYAAAHPEFPHQSTADQFFDEVQFEAYRELGYRLAADMLEARVPVTAADARLPHYEGPVVTPNLGALIRACAA